MKTQHTDAQKERLAHQEWQEYKEGVAFNSLWLTSLEEVLATQSARRMGRFVSIKGKSLGTEY